MLEDWGDLIGLKGSGSNSVVIDNVVRSGAPHRSDRQLMGEWPLTTKLLPGGAIHGNPMYSGGFMGFAIGELTVVQVGAARGMLDLYEEMLGSMSITSMSGNVTTKRYLDHDFQRSFGMALGWVDGAHGIMMRAGEIYMDLARRAVESGQPVSSADHWRLYGMIQTAARLSWEAGELLFRTAGSVRHSMASRCSGTGATCARSDRTRSTSSTSGPGPSRRPGSASRSTGSSVADQARFEIVKIVQISPQVEPKPADS